MQTVSKKVILTGSFGVGKTSLFNQFVFNRFSDKYLTTIGVKVNKKDVFIKDSKVSILLWDIAGEVAQDKVPVSYFLGSSGVIYVVDLTRPSTFKNMKDDIAYLKGILINSTIRIVGNKKDLLTDNEIATILKEIPIPCDIVTSAKTGENVEELFQQIAADFL